MKSKIISLIVVFSLFAGVLHAQEEENTLNATPSLPEHFQEMKTKAPTYEKYRLITFDKLDNFWVAVEDTIKKDREEIGTLRVELATVQKELSEAKAVVSEKDAQIEQGEYISFLGIPFLKTTYIILNVVIIIALVLVILVGLGKYKTNQSIVENTNKEYKNLESEFSQFKNRAQEKEMKIRRELVTERNNSEELKKKIIELKNA